MILPGAAYYPEQRDPGRWEHDLALMAGAHIKVLRMGEFAWCFFEPRPGEYDFGWMDGFLERAQRHGIRALLCPPMRTLPAWLATGPQEEALSIERKDGVRLAYGSRYSFCINQPLLRDAAARLAEAMGRHYADSPHIFGWHLDNEHGDEPDCHCATCKKLFQQFCAERYGDIAALNDAWGTAFWGLRFDSFDQLPTPRVSKTYHSPGHLLDWRRFRSEAVIRAVNLQAAAIRATAGDNVLLTTNNQGLWHPRVDYFDMARGLNTAGTNYYPPYGSDNPFGSANGLALAAVRAYQDGKNFHIHELRCGPHAVPGRADNTPAPGEVMHTAMHAIANGADAFFFFRWRACPFGVEQSHGSITDYDGEPTRIYNEVKELGALVARLNTLPQLVATESDAALLYDFPTRWYFDSSAPEWGAPAGFYSARANAAFLALRLQGVNADVVARRHDWHRYKLLVIPLLAAVDDALAEKLRAYVEAGGTVLCFPLCAHVDARHHIFPGRLHPRLTPLFGPPVRDFITAAANETIPFSWQGEPAAGMLFADLLAGDGYTPRGTFSEGWYAGRPACVETRLGKGRVVRMAVFPDDAALQRVTRDVLAECGIAPILATPPPQGVEVTRRRTLDGTHVVFILNGTAVAKGVSLPHAMTDFLTRETRSGDVVLQPFETLMLSHA